MNLQVENLNELKYFFVARNREQDSFVLLNTTFFFFWCGSFPVLLPIFLQGKIADIIKNKVNNSINATLDFDEANLSLIKSFPNAHVSLKGISLVNHAPFEGDTLFSSGEVELKMAITELFKSAACGCQNLSCRINFFL